MTTARLAFCAAAVCCTLAALLVIVVYNFAVRPYTKPGAPSPAGLLVLPPNLNYLILPPVSAEPTAEPSSCPPAGCPPARCGTDAALASCVAFDPRLNQTYYDAAQLYFDELDPNYPLEFPEYGAAVARWEWPPWLLLTAFGADDIRAVDTVDRSSAPYAVPAAHRHCWLSEQTPFARCRVHLSAIGVNVTTVGGGSTAAACEIYEEFTFNAQGEVTFIEAWSDNLPKPPRMSTRIPGLGSPDSKPIDTADEAVWRAAADADPDVYSFWVMAQNWLTQAVSAALTLGRIHGGIQTEYRDGCYFPDPHDATELAKGRLSK